MTTVAGRLPEAQPLRKPWGTIEQWASVPLWLKRIRRGLHHETHEIGEYSWYVMAVAKPKPIPKGALDKIETRLSLQEAHRGFKFLYRILWNGFWQKACFAAGLCLSSWGSASALAAALCRCSRLSPFMFALLAFVSLLVALDRRLAAAALPLLLLVSIHVCLKNQNLKSIKVLLWKNYMQ